MLVVTMFMTFHAPSLGLSCMWAIKRECRVTLDARRVQWDRMVVLSSGPLVGGVLGHRRCDGRIKGTSVF